MERKHRQVEGRHLIGQIITVSLATMQLVAALAEEQWIQQVEQLEAERNMQYVTSVERIAMRKGREEGREEVVFPSTPLLRFMV